MSVLRIYSETNATIYTEVMAKDAIQEHLAAVAVDYDCWPCLPDLAVNNDEDVLLAYQEQLRVLRERYGLQYSDVVALNPAHPEREALRQQFLAEHRHDDFEARFFVAGEGLFYIHCAEKVFALLCQQGDLISIPRQTLHWFDMGATPSFRCIRLFSTRQGWQANYSGSDIARQYPDLTAFKGDGMT